ncbi:MAG: preprotein translocase subunit SecE [Bdellovibrionales bacterium]|nr:preprotein translocase subunit SecE [Bdellovibrionales bacterium]
MAANTEQASNPISRGINFITASWQELKKVHPPTRQETIQATIVVLVMVVMFATFLGLADYIVGNIMQAILT